MYAVMFIGILTTLCLMLGFTYVHLDKRGLYPRKYKKGFIPAFICPGFFLFTAFIMEITIGPPPEGSFIWMMTHEGYDHYAFLVLLAVGISGAIYCGAWNSIKRMARLIEINMKNRRR